MSMTNQTTTPDKPNVFLNCLCIGLPVALVLVESTAGLPLVFLGAAYGIFLMTRRTVHSRQIGRSLVLGGIIASALWYLLFRHWVQQNAQTRPNPVASGNGAAALSFGVERHSRAVPEQQR